MPRRSVEDTGEERGEHREAVQGSRGMVCPIATQISAIAPQHSPYTDHPHAGTHTPNIARTFVRLPRCGWEDVRDGCAAFLVFRAGSARTLKQ